MLQTKAALQSYALAHHGYCARSLEGRNEHVLLEQCSTCCIPRGAFTPCFAQAPLSPLFPARFSPLRQSGAAGPALRARACRGRPASGLTAAPERSARGRCRPGRPDCPGARRLARVVPNAKAAPQLPQSYVCSLTEYRGMRGLTACLPARVASHPA